MDDLNNGITSLRMQILSSNSGDANAFVETTMADQTIAPPGLLKSQPVWVNGNSLTDSQMNKKSPDYEIAKDSVGPEIIHKFESGLWPLPTIELTQNSTNGFCKYYQNGNSSMQQTLNEVTIEKELTPGSSLSPERAPSESLWLSDIPSIREAGANYPSSFCPTTTSNADNYEIPSSCQYHQIAACCAGDNGANMNAITAVDKYLTDNVIDSFRSLETHYPSICPRHQDAVEGLSGIIGKCQSNETSLQQGDSLVKQMMIGLRSQLTVQERLPVNYQITTLHQTHNNDYVETPNYDNHTQFDRDEIIPALLDHRQRVNWRSLEPVHCISEPQIGASLPTENHYSWSVTQNTKRHQVFVPLINADQPLGSQMIVPSYVDQDAYGPSAGLGNANLQEVMQIMMQKSWPGISTTFTNMDVMMGKGNHSYIKSCAMKNRYAAQKLCRKYAQLSQRVDQCFGQLYEKMRSRRNILMEKLNTVYQMKLNSLNMQIQSMHNLEVALSKGQVPVEAVQRKLELYSIPSDDDAITLHLDDDMWKIQNSIERFGQITTNACASLSFICKDSLINLGHPRTANCAPSPFSCVLVKKPFRVEVQTKNYLGILMTHGGDVVQASIIQANGQTYTAHVCDCRTGRYLITTMFMNAGQYLMTVSVNGKMIKDAPLQIFAHTGSSDDHSDADPLCGIVAPLTKTDFNGYRPYWLSDTLFPRRQRKFSIQFVPTLTALERGRERNLNLTEIMSTPPAQLSKSRLSDGSTITSSSMFCRPWGVCTDSLDNIYVADRSNNHIKIFNTDGCKILILGRQGRNQSEFDRPSGVTFDRLLQRLIVCDKDNHRIQVFNCDPEVVKQMCLSGHNSEFDKITDSNGSSNPTSLSNQLNSKYSHSLFIELQWKPLKMFGSRGNYVGEFHYPWDCATNSRSEILVTDTRNHRIQLFTSEGMFMQKFGFDGLLWKRFDSPRGITVTPDDMVVVSDFNNHKIVIFEPGLVNERYIGGEGNEPGKLKRPQGVCVDQHCNILVADSRNYRIQAFSTKGVFRYQFGSFGEDNGDEMDRPAGVCVGNNGTVFVVDFGNNRVLAF